jgi:hypothetical protein
MIFRRVKMNQSKRDRFVRLAETRTNKVIKLMQLLGNCGNKNNYEYTEEDARKIVQAIEKEIVNLKKALQLDEEENSTFKL